MFRYVCAVAALVCASPAVAQDVATMDAYVSAQEDAGTFMGSVLVAKSDDVLLNKGYGKANLSWDVPNSGSTKFRIGSVTKQFTAVAILVLEEQGRLSLDAPIATYLDDTPDAWAAVTVEHLLTHTSGIPSFTSLATFPMVKMLPASRDTLLSEFRDLPLEFEPGSKFRYSNSGYLLLTAIVEDVSEQNYGEFLRENILTPLEMADTGVDDNTSIIPQRASGYSPTPSGIVRAEYTNMNIPQGAGALYSTTHDLLKWQRGLFEGEIISAASLEKFVAPARDNYALGIFVRRNEAGTTYLHNGGIEGFNSWLGYDPDREVTVAVLSNLNGPAADTIGGALMGLAQGGKLNTPIERKEISLTPTQLAEYEGVYALAPTFKITVFRENDALRAQATGQPAFAMAAERQDLFFVKAADAQIRFERNDEGAISGLTLLQNGRELAGQKE